MIATIIFMVIGALALGLGLALIKIAGALVIGGWVSYLGFALMVSMMVVLPYCRIRAKWHTRKMRYMYDYLSKSQNRTVKEVIEFNKETCRLKAKATTPCWTFYNKYWLNKFQTIDLLTVADDEDEE